MYGCRGCLKKRRLSRWTCSWSVGWLRSIFSCSWSPSRSCTGCPWLVEEVQALSVVLLGLKVIIIGDLNGLAVLQVRILLLILPERGSDEVLSLVMVARVKEGLVVKGLVKLRMIGVRVIVEGQLLRPRLETQLKEIGLLGQRDGFLLLLPLFLKVLCL